MQAGLIGAQSNTNPTAPRQRRLYVARFLNAFTCIATEVLVRSLGDTSNRRSRVCSETDPGDRRAVVGVGLYFGERL
jgi:hypothetical protein